MNTKIAAYDLGTNSTRFMCVSEKIKNIEPEDIVEQKSRITRLGEGVEETGEITNQSRERVVNTIRDFDSLLSSRDFRWVGGIATSACRRANEESVARLFDEVKDITETYPELISGAEEAKLTCEGVLFSLKGYTSGVILDIGGGSTEWISFKSSTPDFLKSIKTGVVTLKERCVDEDRWNEKIDNCIEENLRSVFLTELSGSPPLIIVGGTGTTISALLQGLESYDSNKVHGHSIHREQIDELLKYLKSKSFDELSSEPMIKAGREDVLIPGIKILKYSMNVLETDRAIVSEYGILSGYISEATDT